MRNKNCTRLQRDEQTIIYCFYLYPQYMYGIGVNNSAVDPPNTCNHHHHQVPDLEQTLATMPLQTSLSSDNFKKFKPLLCPPVAELQRLSRNVIRCLPLSRLPSRVLHAIAS